MDLDIHQMNVGYLMTMVISKLNESLIRNSRRNLHLFFFGKQQENNFIVQHVVYDIILQDNKQISVKDETHENIDDKVNEYEL